MMTLHTCLVFGWKGLENKPEFPFNLHEICACCGSQYGLDIQENRDIDKVRDEWIEEGANWFDDGEGVTPAKPKKWSVQIAKNLIQEAFG